MKNLSIISNGVNNTLSLNLPLSIRFNFRLNWKIFWTLSFILIITLSISYIFQVNFLAEETYKIQNYRKKIDKLILENEAQRTDSVKANSLSNIETLIKDLGFEKVQNVHYIQVLESQVVTK